MLLGGRSCRLHTSELTWVRPTVKGFMHVTGWHRWTISQPNMYTHIHAYITPPGLGWLGSKSPSESASSRGQNYFPIAIFPPSCNEKSVVIKYNTLTECSRKRASLDDLHLNKPDIKPSTKRRESRMDILDGNLQQTTRVRSHQKTFWQLWHPYILPKRQHFKTHPCQN